MSDPQDTMTALKAAAARARLEAERRADLIDYFAAIMERLQNGNVSTELQADNLDLPSVITLTVTIPRDQLPPTAAASPASAPAPATDSAPPTPEPVKVDDQDSPPEAPAQLSEPVETHATLPAPERVTGPLSDEELQVIRAALDAGEAAGPVAERLRRPGGVIGMRMAQMRKELAADKPDTSDTAAETPKPDAKAQTPRANFAAASQPDAALLAAGTAIAIPEDLPPARRQLRQFLRSVGWPDPWSIHKDYLIMRALARGDGLSGAAEITGVARDLVKLRIGALWPEKTLEAQTFLNRELSALVQEAEQAGAEAA